jgi:DNA-directed RNA polymerase III subunit RPC3
VISIAVYRFLITNSRQSELVVRVNYDKLNVVFRTERIISLTEKYGHPFGTHIYKCLLRRIEHETHQCRETAEIPREGEETEEQANPIPISDLVGDVDRSLDFAAAIGPLDPWNASTWRGRRALENRVNGDNASYDETSNLEEDVDQHLALLAQPPLKLAIRQELFGRPRWTVHFRSLAKQLRHMELEKIIGTRYGAHALRIIRALESKGKLEERRLQEICLIPTKELRQNLANMQMGGFVDLQEVPRDSQRQPSRTIYLWFYDPDRLGRNLLHDTYKAMSRCLQRIRFERSLLQTLLTKAERTDVKGKEKDQLQETELVVLQEWQNKEALLLGEVARLDDLVAVFRDF